MRRVKLRKYIDVGEEEKEEVKSLQSISTLADMYRNL